ncbi:MAG: helix-turn-helix domain-containing protein [Thermoleophilia bacterium]
MFEIGNTLREARLRRGLDILDCEAETKIRSKYLRAMEEEHFDLMPSPTYVRGFLRTYAEFLDLDGRLVLDEYESRFGDLERAYDPHARSARGAAAAGRPSTSRSADRGRSPRGGEARAARGSAPERTPRRRRRTEAQLLWLAIGGVMAVALLVWLGIGAPDDSPTPLPSTPSTGAATSSGAVAPALAEDPDTESAEAPMPKKATPIVLTGTGTDGCWVRVRSRTAEGRIVYEGIIAPGTSRTFRIREAIWINAANPAGLVVTIGGVPAELGSTASGNWTITPQGVKADG